MGKCLYYTLQFAAIVRFWCFSPNPNEQALPARILVQEHRGYNPVEGSNNTAPSKTHKTPTFRSQHFIFIATLIGPHTRLDSFPYSKRRKHCSGITRPDQTPASSSRCSLPSPAHEQNSNQIYFYYSITMLSSPLECRQWFGAPRLLILDRTRAGFQQKH